MKKITLLLASLIALTILPLNVFAQQKYSLQLRYKVGDSFTYRIETTQEINQIINRNWISILMNFAVDLGFSIENVTETEQTIRITYKRINIAQSRNKSSLFEFDSQNPPAEIPDYLKGSAALVNESFAVTMSASGKILRIIGVDQLMQNLNDKIAIENPAMKEQVLANVKNQFDDDAIKDLFNNLSIYPNDKVAVGTSWNHKQSLKKNIPMEVSAQYRLDNIKDNLAEISVLSNFTSPAGGSAMQIGNISLLYFINGKQSGDIIIELTSGKLLSSKMRQALSGKVSMSQNPQQQWPISMVSTVNFFIIP